MSIDFQPCQPHRSHGVSDPLEPLRLEVEVDIEVDPHVGADRIANRASTAPSRRVATGCPSSAPATPPCVRTPATYDDSRPSARGRIFVFSARNPRFRTSRACSRQVVVLTAVPALPSAPRCARDTFRNETNTPEFARGSGRQTEPLRAPHRPSPPRPAAHSRSPRSPAGSTRLATAESARADVGSPASNRSGSRPINSGASPLITSDRPVLPKLSLNSDQPTMPSLVVTFRNENIRQPASA